MKFYVYELADPRNDEVFYVGKGTGRRIDQHECDARKNQRSKRADRIRAIWADGHEIIKRKVEWFDDEDMAYEAERLLIEAYGLRTLTNVQPGGVGSASVPDDEKAHRDRVCVKCATRVILKVSTHPMIMNDADAAPAFMRLLINWRAQVDAVIARRGADWVNEIARPIGLEFQTG